MVLNKKASILNLWFMIVAFNIFIAIGFTILVGFNNMALDQIVTPIYNEVSDVASTRTSVDIQNHIDDAYQGYQDNSLPWDLIIFGLIINFYFFILFSAIKTRKENPFIVFSLLTFGSIFLLLLISISVDVQTWIINEIYVDVFEDLSYNTPIMDWMFLNIGLVSFIMAMTVILVNQFERLKNLILGGNE